MEQKEPNGWFEKYVTDNLKMLRADVLKLQGSVTKIHERVDKIHAPPCSGIVSVKEDTAQLKTTIGLFKWLVGGMVLSLLGLVVSLLMILIRNVS
jgi:hypothetical protein